MHHFFIDPHHIAGEQVSFPAETARQISRVLRLKPGTMVAVLDNRGSRFTVALEVVEKELVSGRVTERMDAAGEPAVRVVLDLCLTQREKFEWALQKCTEAGAAAFRPLVSQRSLVQNTTEAEAKRGRWERILQEAAEQCGRGRIPQLLPTARLEEMLQQPSEPGLLRLALWEDEQRTTLKGALTGWRGGSVELLVGPEGGLAETEVQGAQAAGFRTVTLGRRTLRMETAALAGTLLVLHELGEN